MKPLWRVVRPQRLAPRPGSALLSLVLLAGLLAVASLLSGCTGGGAPLRLLGHGGGAEEPWELPASSYPSQRLYRIHYEGPDQEASFKLTLYLVTPDRYRMLAADTLGRKLWTLDVAGGGEAAWVDHRGDTYCRLGVARELGFVPLARLPLLDLPKLLLGRLPATPTVDLERQEGYLSYLDTSGRRWSGRLDGEGRVEWWSLEDGGEKVAWWLRDDVAGGTFTHLGTDQQLRFRQVVGEALAAPLEALEIPARYREGVCDPTDTSPQAP